MPRITRRDLLLDGLAASLLTACGARVRAPARVDVPKELIVRIVDPFCGEPVLPSLVDAWITPVRRFFVLDHAEAPRLSEDHAIELTGLVRRRRRVHLRELAGRPPVTVAATLMCAGNRRREHHVVRPVRDPLIWDAGAIGNALWTGVPLADLLEEAGLLAGASHVWLDGVDGDGWGASIPLARALDRRAPPVLLAYAMNGAALPRHHGFPVRAIVPGYIGARSVKWLGRVTVAAAPSSNPHFIREHRLDGAPIHDVPINGAICGAEAGVVAGYALAPVDATIAAVDLSTDDGATWRPATLRGPSRPGCWRLWSCAVGDAPHVVARAVDTHGRVQPERVAWNPGGYLYNAWPRATMT